MRNAHTIPSSPHTNVAATLIRLSNLQEPTTGRTQKPKCVRSADGTRGGGGLSSLELFSMGLKATGSYMSRALSYRGATFDLASVDIDDTHKCAQTPEQT